MKKKLVIFFGLAFMCVGCGSSYESDKASVNGTKAPYTASGYDYDETNGYGNDALYEYDYYDSEMQDSVYAEDSAYAAATEAAGDVESEGMSESSGVNTNHTSTGNGDAVKLSKEMLVYRGTLSIDTLDFNKSVNDFKTLLNDKGGFVESESYSDNSTTSGYYVVDELNKHNVYTATVRVPSKEYDGIMNSSSNLGDVRKRTSNASNVTQQYSTYKSQLEIYEAEYKRYLSLLEKATEDEYALQIENELFDIQIRISELKSGISNIENDVAYSYIDITIKEVSEYEEKPVKTDTFADRLKNTCKDSWNEFLSFLEDVLFYVIRNIYYIIIFGVVLIAVYRIIRKKRKARANKLSQENLETETEKGDEAEKDENVK